MKIVLLGRQGQLGQAFAGQLPALGECHSLGRAELDLRDGRAIERILTALQPDLIVNTAAYTEVDRAEHEPELAYAVNALAPGRLAETARRLGARLVHFSTDYVFDGEAGRPYREADPPNPLNTYGRSKLAGEAYIQQAGGNYLILRTSWVYSLDGRSFVNKVLGWSRQQETLRIVSDQVGCPTWATALARTTCRLLQNHLLGDGREWHGVYNLCGNGFTSRFDWARQILARDPRRGEQRVRTLEPAATRDFPTPARRPLFSALDCTALRETFQLEMPAWEASLQEALAAAR